MFKYKSLYLEIKSRSARNEENIQWKRETIVNIIKFYINIA